MTIKVGSLGYATVQGLGILAKQFFDAGIVDSFFVLEHHCRKNHLEWYPGAPHAPSREVARGNCREVDRWLDGIDVLLVFETPFDWKVTETCFCRGKPVLFMPMHECTPQNLPGHVDRFLCPSALDLKVFSEAFPKKAAAGKVVQVQVPVVDPMQHGRLRNHSVKTFVHNSGNGGLRGRNGTAELIDALFLLTLRRLDPRDVLKTIVRSQIPLSETESLQKLMAKAGNSVRWDVGRTLSTWDLWAEGDAFVFPEKFNGLSLPLQEAFASGMIVLATDRFPNSEWLPKEALIPSHGSKKARVGPAFREFDEAIVSASDVADKMSEVAGWPDEKVAEISARGLKWGRENSWDALKSEWLQIVGKD